MPQWQAACTARPWLTYSHRALPPLIPRNHNSFHGWGWGQSGRLTCRNPDLGKSNTSEALRSLCSKLYIFYQLSSHGPQQVGEDFAFHRKAMRVTEGTEVRSLPPNTRISSTAWRAGAASVMRAGLGRWFYWLYVSWLGHGLPQPLCCSHLPLMDGEAPR